MSGCKSTRDWVIVRHGCLCFLLPGVAAIFSRSAEPALSLLLLFGDIEQAQFEEHALKHPFFKLAKVSLRFL